MIRITVVTALLAATTCLANTYQVPLHVGRIWTNPEYDGAEGFDGSALQYPGGTVIASRTPWSNTNSIKRGWIGQGRKLGTYLMSTDWTDPDSIFHEWTSSYMFRTYNYDSYGSDDWLVGTAGTSFNYLYPGGIGTVGRWARPRIVVNGAEIAFRPDPYPDGCLDCQRRYDLGETIDPDLVVEHEVYTWWRYIQGVEYRRHIYAYPMGSPHQDYFLMDITLTNNGISGANSDVAPVLTGQTLNGVIWSQAYDFSNYHAESDVLRFWDNHARFTDPWGSGNKVLYWYDGNAQDLVPDSTAYAGNDWGDPTTDPRYDGHLLGNAHIMWGPLFVSTSPAEFDVNLTGQPEMRVIAGERGMDFDQRYAYLPTSPEEQRAYIASGEQQLPTDTDYRDDPIAGQWADPATGEGATGGTMLLGYGPLNATMSYANIGAQGWTLGWQDSLRIVQVIAAGGLDRNWAQVIGKEWNERRIDDPTGDWFAPDEIAAIKSGEDTVRKAVNLAYWNFHGEWAPDVDQTAKERWGIGGYLGGKPGGRGPFDVPDAPRPPANFSVRTRAVDVECGGIELRWSTEAESDPDFDTGVPDFSHYRIYRQEGSRLAPWELIVVIPAYHLATAEAGEHGVDFGGRVYYDHDVTGGVDYWYSVVAVDDGSQNWAQPGVPLESSRWWTWSGYSEPGVTATTVDPGPGCFTRAESRPAKTFALHPAAPNPFNPSTTLRFSVAEAGAARLAVYDTNGRWVRGLVDGYRPAGQHAVVWNGTDDSGRPVASGVYLVRLTWMGGSAASAERTERLVRGTWSEVRRVALVR